MSPAAVADSDAIVNDCGSTKTNPAGGAPVGAVALAMSLFAVVPLNSSSRAPAA